MDILQYIMDGEPPMTIEQARQDEEDLRYHLADLILNPENYMDEQTLGEYLDPIIRKATEDFFNKGKSACPVDPADLEGCDSCQ